MPELGGKPGNAAAVGLGAAAAAIIVVMEAGWSFDGAPQVSAERVYPRLAFEQPVGLHPVPGAPHTRFVVEKAGRIVAFDARDPTDARVVLDIRDRVDAGPNEAGLLGLAFHPDYRDNSSLYLSYTRPGDPLVSHIARFTATTEGTVDPTSERTVLTLEQPFGNHNGGNIAFGPDGYLYIGFGDGGAGGDPHGNGQDTDTLLGAMLRIDVDGASPYAIPPDNPFADGGGGRPELYAWGLRNPWRWSFDPPTGRLWAGDVGQERWEEVDVIRRGGNYGWNVREGDHCYESTTCPSEGLVGPAAEYSHEEGCSITGGYVYRGEAIPSLKGQYLFGDYCSGRVWALRENGSGGWEKRVLVDTGLSISSFARGPDGEIHLLDYRSGGVYRLTAR